MKTGRVGRPAGNIFMKPVTTTVPIEDYQYVKEKGLKFQNLLMMAIRDHRVHTDDPDAVPTIREMRSRIERLQERLQNILDALQKRMTEDDYMKFITEEIK